MFSWDGRFGRYPPISGGGGSLTTLVVLLTFCFQGVGSLVRSEDQRHIASFEPSFVLDFCHRADRFDDTVENPGSQLGMGHLSPSELQGDLHLVALLEELDEVPDLRVEVTFTDLGSELDLLDRDIRGLLARLFGLLGLLVPELAVIHDPADRRVRHRCHFDEIEIETAGQFQRVWNRCYTQLVAIGPDEADLSRPDPIIDPVLVALGRSYGRSLLCNGCFLPVRLDVDEHEAELHAERTLRRRPGRTVGGQVGVQHPTSSQLCSVG